MIKMGMRSIIFAVIVIVLAAVDAKLYLACRELEKKIDSIDNAVYEHMKDEFNEKVGAKND